MRRKKSSDIPKIPGFHVEVADFSDKPEIENYGVLEGLVCNDTDVSILIAIAQSESPISPYELEAIVGRAYNQIFYSCKKFFEAGILNRTVTTSAKGGKKHLYSLSYFGYHFCLSEVEWGDSAICFNIAQNYRTQIRGADVCLSIFENIKNRYSEDDLNDIQKTDQFVSNFLNGSNGAVVSLKGDYLTQLKEYIANALIVSSISVILYITRDNVEEKIAESMYVDFLINNLIKTGNLQFTTILIDDILPCFEDEPEYQNIAYFVKPEVFKHIYFLLNYALILDIPDDVRSRLKTLLYESFSFNTK